MPPPPHPEHNRTELCTTCGGGGEGRSVQGSCRSELRLKIQIQKLHNWPPTPGKNLAAHSCRIFLKQVNCRTHGFLYCLLWILFFYSNPPLQSVSELMARQLFLVFIHVHISEHMFQEFTTRGGEIPFKCSYLRYFFF